MPLDRLFDLIERYNEHVKRTPGDE